MAAGPTYEPIATTTLGSAQAGITFSSIPNTYTDLRLIIVATSSVGNNCRIQFNSDTATNYSRTEIYGDGTATGSSTAINQAFIDVTNGVQLSTTVPTLLTIDIFNYAGSTFKTLLSTESGDRNGSGAFGGVVGQWRSTTAISTIYAYASTGNIAAGSIATLYGITKA